MYDITAITMLFLGVAVVTAAKGKMVHNENGKADFILENPQVVGGHAYSVNQGGYTITFTDPGNIVTTFDNLFCVSPQGADVAISMLTFSITAD